jgi:hypothetical protein
VSRRRVKSCLNVASFCFLDIACRSVELDRRNGDFSHRFRSDNWQISAASEGRFFISPFRGR